jgi:hypothetical protein
VGTLNQDGSAIAQSVSAGDYLADGSLTVAATAWANYILQTDHYVIAFFGYGGYYNPFYYSEGSCDDGSGDCTIGGSYGPLFGVAASIYLGTTIADQLDVPSQYDSSILSKPKGLPGNIQLKVDIWHAAVFGAAAAIANFARSDSSPYHPVPAYLNVVGDCHYLNHGQGVAQRPRTYQIFDQLGHPYAGSAPILVKENILTYSGPAIIASGNWGRNVSADDPISGNGMFDDDVQSGVQGQSKAIQQFWASNFSVPGGLALPSISGYPSGTVPLAINDKISPQKKGIFSQLDITYDPSFIGINGDNGNAPNKYWNGISWNSCGSN